MKAIEIMKETYSRKSYIRLVHVVWVCMYIILFFFPLPPDIWSWGFLLFALNGALLPIILSAGIFGDDFASGRIRMLMTRPVSPVELYIYRLAGLSLQGTFNFVISACVVIILHSLTGRGSVNSLAWCLLSGWLLLNMLAAISTTLSVLVKGAYNSVILLLIAFLGLPMIATMLAAARDHQTTATLITIGKYIIPVQRLFTLLRGEYGLVGVIVCFVYAIVYVVLFSVIGTLLLCRREYATHAN